MEEKIVERIAKLEANDANIFHQLSEIKTEVKDIRRLTTAVEKIAVQTENITRKVDGIDARLDNVEKQSVEEYKHYKRVIVSCVITGIIGTIIGAIFALIIN